MADDPFTKLDVSKYYPEVVVVDGGGAILARICPDAQQTPDFSSLCYTAVKRDDKLRINDDSKVKIRLDQFGDSDTMILLLVRSRDTRREPIDDKVLKNSWFRLQNEDTNQTLDYTFIAGLELPEDYAEGEV